MTGVLIVIPAKAGIYIIIPLYLKKSLKLYRFLIRVRNDIEIPD